MGIWYCTEGDVMSALDFKETARNAAQVGRCIDAGARQIESLCNRVFYPTDATRYFDWPNRQTAYPWRLWFEENDLVTATQVTSGGTVIGPSGYFLEPVNSGPPFEYLEINRASSSAFSAGTTAQRSIGIAGTWGYGADVDPAGATAEALDTSETAVDVTDSSLVDVGHVLLVDSERMIVTGRAMLDTGQNIVTGGTTAVNSDVGITVASGAALHVGETILVDSERMLIVDIAGNVVTVKRAWAGSVLATHSTADIFAPRTLTVVRGALGTTAASHLTAAAAYTHSVPFGIRALNVAEALNMIEQETGGYARTVGSGDNQRAVGGAGLPDLRAAARATYGRLTRMQAV